MQHLQAEKFVGITPPAAIVDNAAFTTAAIDTRGFNELLILVYLGALDIALAALKLTESEASDMSNATDISGTVGGTSYTLPIDTADNTFIAFHVKTGGQRKRYIDLTITGGDGTAGTFMAAVAILGKGLTTPTTDAQRGAALVVNV